MGEPVSTVMAAASSASVCLCIFVARAKSCIKRNAATQEEAESRRLQLKRKPEEEARPVEDLTFGGSHVVFSDQTRPCPNEAVIRHPAHLSRAKTAGLISVPPTPARSQSWKRLLPRALLLPLIAAASR